VNCHSTVLCCSHQNRTAPKPHSRHATCHCHILSFLNPDSRLKITTSVTVFLAEGRHCSLLQIAWTDSGTRLPHPAACSVGTEGLSLSPRGELARAGTWPLTSIGSRLRMNGAALPLSTGLQGVHRMDWLVLLCSVWRRKKLNYTQLKRYMLLYTEIKLYLLLWREKKLESEWGENLNLRKSVLRKMQPSVHDWRTWVCNSQHRQRFFCTVGCFGFWYHTVLWADTSMLVDIDASCSQLKEEQW
jgi:hypothetical protein